MERKRWTPKTDITQQLLKFREKRKWQLTLRRYVLEKKASPAYAFYFGLDIAQFRQWIEIQFDANLNWENFGMVWQFYHIIPIGYFDFSKEDDLRLCWNFVNIRVERMKEGENIDEQRIDILAARSYFEALYNTTGYAVCVKMIEKIATIEKLNIYEDLQVEQFLLNNKDHIEKISSLDKEEFNNLNLGMTLDEIILEREILKKFG